jgi:hypothetical protein
LAPLSSGTVYSRQRRYSARRTHGKLGCSRLARGSASGRSQSYPGIKETCVYDSHSTCGEVGFAILPDPAMPNVITVADVERGRWLFSAWKHLRTFQADHTVRFEATVLAGKAADLLGRLRGLQHYSIAHVVPLAKDAGITGRELRDTLLPTLEGLGILQIERDSANRIRTLRAVIIGEDDVMAQAARVWDYLDPEVAERGALICLREVAALPRTEDELVEACEAAGLDGPGAKLGLELAEGHGLVMRTHVGELGGDFLYNDFLWGEDIQRTTRALAALPSDMRDNMRSLLDELHQNEGRPLKAIESASPDLIEMAVANGLIERAEIVTATGKTGSFHFTPRFKGFGVARDDVPDALDQIRLVIASFAFAAHYAQYRLNSPEVFLESLIDKGYAGNASPIGTDYGALEKQKIVDVQPIRPGAARYRFVALKTDSLVAALDTMRAGALLRPGSGSGSGSGLLQPREFADPVATRLRLGQRAEQAPQYQETLLAAVRDAAQQDRFR